MLAPIFCCLFLLRDVIEEALVDIDGDHLGRLLRDRKRKITRARADVGHGLALERSEAGDDLLRLLPFGARGILEASRQLVEVCLVHELVRGTFLGSRGIARL